MSEYEYTIKGPDWKWKLNSGAIPFMKEMEHLAMLKKVIEGKLKRLENDYTDFDTKDRLEHDLGTVTRMLGSMDEHFAV